MKILATAVRVLNQVRHDPRTIGLLLLIPSVVIGLMAWLFDDTTIFATVGPPLIGLFPFTIMFVITSVATLRERRSGTLERLLAMPLTKLDFILGYTIAFGVLSIAQSLVTVAFAVWVCGLTITGSVILFVTVTVIVGLLGTVFGLLASAFARTEFQAVQFMPAFVFPQIILGGVIIPREQMPDALYAISDWLPLSHGIDALSAVARDTEDAAWVGGKLLILAAFAIAAIALSAITLRRRSA